MLDVDVGDIHGSIIDREIEINFMLHQELLEFIPYIESLIDKIANLDCVVSFARVSQGRKFTRPIMSSNPVLRIINGRHPLQELCVDAFVSNSVDLDSKNPIIVLTGPNSSGKTVILKQVALIVFMAHIGWYDF